MKKQTGSLLLKIRGPHLKFFNLRLAVFMFHVSFLALCMLPFSLQAATLEPDTGARPLGMSAFAAVADDINAVSWNPAGLSLLQSQEAATAYAPIYGFDTQIRESYLAYAYPSGRWGTIGISFSYLDYGSMDWRDESGVKLGDFSRADYSIYTSYGIRLVESLNLGLSVGTTTVGIDSMEGSATGLGLDLGLMYSFAGRASLGLCVENLGGVSAGDRDIARQKVRTGVAFSALNRPDMGLVAALDIEEQQGKTDTVYSGFEWSIFSPSSFFVKRKIQERYIELGRYRGIANYREGIPQQRGKISLCIRGGVRKRLAVSEPLSLSGGVSIRYRLSPDSLTLKFEHAFLWHRYLDTTHRFSLGLEMGGSPYN